MYYGYQVKNVALAFRRVLYKVAVMLTGEDDFHWCLWSAALIEENVGRAYMMLFLLFLQESQLAEKEKTMEKWRQERDTLVAALEVQLKRLLSSQAEKDKLIQQLQQNNTQPPQEVSITQRGSQAQEPESEPGLLLPKKDGKG